MRTLHDFVATVDFRCSQPLTTVARVLSSALFCGIEFEGENTGIWDEVPAVKLSRNFLGLAVELGGGDEEYTLHVETSDFVWDLVPAGEYATSRINISEYVAHLLAQIPGIEVLKAGR